MLGQYQSKLLGAKLVFPVKFAGVKFNSGEEIIISLSFKSQGRTREETTFQPLLEE